MFPSQISKSQSLLQSTNMRICNVEDKDQENHVVKIYQRYNYGPILSINIKKSQDYLYG